MEVHLSVKQNPFSLHPISTELSIEQKSLLDVASFGLRLQNLFDALSLLAQDLA
jgi:hypothetical protein